VANVRLQLEVAKEVVTKLEGARDFCPLQVHEESLRQELKVKSLGLPSLQIMIARQE
jgi:hypothetical protein